MNRLIGAFERLFVAATKSAGDLAETTHFALEHVDWTGALSAGTTEHPRCR